MVKAHAFTENLINFLFPFKIDRKCTLPQIELNLSQLHIDFKDLTGSLEGVLETSVNEITKKFFSKIPEVYKALMNDANNFLDFDPAARSIESVILYYPGFYAITVYRLSHELYKLKIPFLPRIMSEYAHSKTGIDIHPGASIGKNFFIDHGTGIVIGETTQIGDNVKIYQGVTLGAICVEKTMKGKKRHPTIEDNVIIYAGSTILGGDTTVGHDSVVGGNVWLTKSVQPYSVLYHESKTIVRDIKMKGEEPINFVI
ncbi:MAG: serine acetyltransferase [Bacteroidales bacterium]|nr:serine acetyltransferase [Bacteroidales bacterium]MBN2818042.1 serine acetyltransferase [Bacteroidales bacterium]